MKWRQITSPPPPPSTLSFRVKLDSRLHCPHNLQSRLNFQGCTKAQNGHQIFLLASDGRRLLSLPYFSLEGVTYVLSTSRDTVLLNIITASLEDLCFGLLIENMVLLSFVLSTTGMIPAWPYPKLAGFVRLRISSQAAHGPLSIGWLKSRISPRQSPIENRVGIFGKEVLPHTRCYPGYSC